MIGPFRNQWRFLSNFWFAEVEHEGVKYPTVEHAYQAAKTNNKEWKEKIRLARMPGDAKRLGRELKDRGLIRPDWKKMSINTMAVLVTIKFVTHKELGEKLKATNDEELVEVNHWHDNFYGSCICPKCEKEPKHNYLGKILMMVRSSLRGGKS